MILPPARLLQDHSEEILGTAEAPSGAYCALYRNRQDRTDSGDGWFSTYDHAADTQSSAANHPSGNRATCSGPTSRRRVVIGLDRGSNYDGVRAQNVVLQAPRLLLRKHIGPGELIANDESGAQW
jgi:hypothetical protein